jgi:hypothetical protein
MPYYPSYASCPDDLSARSEGPEWHAGWLRWKAAEDRKYLQRSLRETRALHRVERDALKAKHRAELSELETRHTAALTLLVNGPDMLA